MEVEDEELVLVSDAVRDVVEVPVPVVVCERVDVEDPVCVDVPVDVLTEELVDELVRVLLCVDVEDPVCVDVPVNVTLLAATTMMASTS